MQISAGTIVGEPIKTKLREGILGFKTPSLAFSGGQPQVFIGMGSAEIKELQTTARAVAITLTDAGARDGKLFFHNRCALKLAGVDSCAAEVNPAGENLWAVSVAKRERGKSHVVRLEVAE